MCFFNVELLIQTYFERYSQRLVRNHFVMLKNLQFRITFESEVSVQVNLVFLELPFSHGKGYVTLNSKEGSYFKLFEILKPRRQHAFNMLVHHWHILGRIFHI